VPNLALRNLWHDRLRSAMTVAGVAFAVTLVFVQIGLFLGLLDNASVMCVVHSVDVRPPRQGLRVLAVAVVAGVVASPGLAQPLIPYDSGISASAGMLDFSSRCGLSISILRR